MAIEPLYFCVVQMSFCQALTKNMVDSLAIDIGAAMTYSNLRIH